MVFKRRNPRTWTQVIREFFYPNGGWMRAMTYVKHRLTRLPDPPHRIARGIFAGCLVSFPPLIGLQLLSAAALAFVIRGNILAALLATFLSNPVTTPFIAVVSMETGYRLLGIDATLTPKMIGLAFADAGSEIWRNFLAIFTDAPTHWDRLGNFFSTVYWPYFIGSLLPGLVVSAICYYLSLPVIHAYQKRREKKRRDRAAKRRIRHHSQADATPPNG